MSNNSFNKWPYILIGTGIGILVCLTVIAIRQLIKARELYKKVKQELTSEKLNDFQKYINDNNFQKIISNGSLNISKEAIDKITEELVANKQKNPSVEKQKNKRTKT